MLSGFPTKRLRDDKIGRLWEWTTSFVLPEWVTLHVTTVQLSGSHYKATSRKHGLFQTETRLFPSCRPGLPADQLPFFDYLCCIITIRNLIPIYCTSMADHDHSYKYLFPHAWPPAWSR